MKNLPLVLFAAALLVFLASCKKTLADRIGNNTNTTAQFTEYLIAKGSHTTSKSTYRAVNTAEMKFVVKFDNSAVYQTVLPDNQLDINKLYGFSDNNQDHHANSARIGWRWYNNSVELFAYVYNDGVVKDRYITAVAIGQEISCSIKVQGDNYTFQVNEVSVALPRTAKTPQAIGYQLYPYFGGDETAPQDIRILIRDN